MNALVESATLLLPETLDLAASEKFLELVQERVGAGGPLRMDASAVKMLTLPCAQIVLAAVRGGDDIKIKDPSTAFAGAFDDLGLEWMAYLERSPSADQDLNDDQDNDQDTSLMQGCDETPGGVEQPAGGNAGFDSTPEPSGHADLHPISESVMSKRILTIDDSKTMRDMLMLTLAGAGFDVIQAVDGQDGLDVLVNEQVDVIITDINMPRMDGYEVIRNLRRDPAHKSTPILVLTTESEAEKKNLAREAGATGWMVKPFDPDRLVATVLKVAP